MELDHLLQKETATFAGLHIQDTVLSDQNQWAQEMRKADERCQTYHQVISELQQKLASEQEFTQ